MVFKVAKGYGAVGRIPGKPPRLKRFPSEGKDAGFWRAYAKFATRIRLALSARNGHKQLARERTNHERLSVLWFSPLQIGSESK